MARQIDNRHAQPASDHCITRQAHGLILALCFGLSLGIISALTRTASWAQSTAGKNSVGAPVQRNLQKRVSIRFLTGLGYPPFNYYDEDNVLSGFNVDMAQAICLELGATCDIKAKPWDQLLPSLTRGDADAIVASQIINPIALRKVDFTNRYYYTPGRFAALRKAEQFKITPLGLEAKLVAVIKGTSHEAYIRDFFYDSRIASFPTAADARKALQRGKVDLIFDDAVSMSFWLNGTIANSCCEFRGGAFSEPKYFGDGIGIAVTKGDRQLQALINKALADIHKSGRYEELFLRYFPIKVY